MFKFFSSNFILLRDYLKNPNKYVKEQIVTIKGKKRVLHGYQPDKNGEKLRRLHTSIVLQLEPLYTSSDCSFAYKKGRNIVDCMNRHLNSDSFLKCDIKDFFGSITYENFVKHLDRTIDLGKKSSLPELLEACFYQGKLPLGFCSSPIISDMYMTKLDKIFAEKSRLVYTRYADDFIISTSSRNAEKLFKDIKSELGDELERFGLKLNDKKTRTCTHLEIGGHFHALGLNIVRVDESKNKITVSDKYLRETCKQLAECLQPEGKPKCNMGEVRGKINFISQASADSYKKFAKLVRIKLNRNLNEILSASYTK